MPFQYAKVDMVQKLVVGQLLKNHALIVVAAGALLLDFMQQILKLLVLFLGIRSMQQVENIRQVTHVFLLLNSRVAVPPFHHLKIIGVSAVEVFDQVVVIGGALQEAPAGMGRLGLLRCSKPFRGEQLFNFFLALGDFGIVFDDLYPIRQREVLQFFFNIGNTIGIFG